jgi:hypothetical protein
MRNLLIALTLAGSICIGGCANTLPRPNSAATAAVELDVAYGLAAHEVMRYLAYPTCTAPLTVVPCKRQDIAERLKAADAKAWDMTQAARTELKALGPDATEVQKIMAATRTAIAFLASLTPSKEASK